MTNTTDTVKWLLYASDLTTRIGNDLPAISSNIYYQNNQPGSGKIKIPLDCVEASLLSTGQFVQCWYRGSARGGFFVDSIVPEEINTQEYSGRVLTISGRGPLAILDTEIIYNSNTEDTKRIFTGVSKASILKTLIDEAKARGSLSTLTYDFTATLDSNGVTWSDSENYEMQVGKKLLDIARQFSQTGVFDFDINLSGSSFVLSAYKAGLGTNKSSTVKLRAGGSIQEASKDQRAGKELVNVYLVKYKTGYITVSDSTSIASHGRNVDFINIEQAQSSDSATTYAAAKLALNKEPKTNKPVKVWDGNAPNVFLDYVMGDTITIDLFGTETQDRILGLQLEFSGENYANVSIDFNTIFYDNELNISSRLEDLESQWSSAKDANLLEAKEYLGIGSPDNAVYALRLYNGILYIGGAFTQIGEIAATHIAQYDTATGIISATDSVGIPDQVLKITEVAGEVYAITDTKIYHFHFGAWVLIGTANASIYDMTTDGTNLYIGGFFSSVSGVATNRGVAKWNGSVWSSVSGAGSTGNTWGLVWFIGTLWLVETSTPDTNTLRKLVAGSWVAQLTSIGKSPNGFGTDGSYLYFRDTAQTTLYRWDGVSASPINFLSTESGGGVRTPYELYLADVYIGETNISGRTIQPIKYSGGLFSELGEGTTGQIYTIQIDNSDVYLGGVFTTLGGKPIAYLSVYVTNFESLVDHLSNDNNSFDLGTAIHGAPAAAVTNASEFPLWDDVTGLLRKITWTNIKATLKTYFDTLYAVLAHTHTGTSDSPQIPTAGIANDAVTYTKIQNVSAGSVLGNPNISSGDVQEITITAQAISLLSDATKAAMRSRIGVIIGTDVVAQSDISASTYTPTLDNTTNVAASSVLGPFTYSKSGSVVTVAGAVSIDPTTTGNTVLGISLPIASNFADAFNASGVGTSVGSNALGNIASDATNDRVTVTFTAVDTASRNWRLVFMYPII
jgi:hypothetical protein